MTKENFSKELRKIRRGQGLTQKQMAYKIKVPYDTYQKWELGIRKPPDYTQEVVKILAIEN